MLMNQAYLLLHKILCLERPLVGSLAFFFSVLNRGRPVEKNDHIKQIWQDVPILWTCWLSSAPSLPQPGDSCCPSSEAGKPQVRHWFAGSTWEALCLSPEICRSLEQNFFAKYLTCNRVLFFFIVSTPSTMGRGVRSTGVLSLFNLCRTCYFKSVE